MLLVLAVDEGGGGGRAAKDSKISHSVVTVAASEDGGLTVSAITVRLDCGGMSPLLLVVEFLIFKASNFSTYS